MPTVKKYGARQIGTAALPGVRRVGAATALSEGAGVEEAREAKFTTLAGVGEDVTRLGVHLRGQQLADRQAIRDEERARAIKFDILRGEADLQTFIRDRVHDEEKGALTLEGDAAMGMPEQIDEEFRARSSEVLQRAGTPEARLALAQSSQQMGQSLALTTRRHTAQEIRKVAASTLKARVEGGIDLAIRDGTVDPLQGAIHLRATEASFREMAPSLGLGKDEIDEQVKTMHTQVHEGIIRQLIADKKPADAQAYFTDAKDDIGTDRLDDITTLLGAANEEQEVQTETERILAEGGTLTEQRTKARAITKPGVKKEVLAALEHEQNVRDSEERRGHRDLLQRITNRLERTMNYNAIPTEEKLLLTTDEKAAFRRYVEQVTTTGDVQKDFKVYYNHIRAMTADPQKWATETNLEADIDKIPRGELHELVGKQASILSGQAKKENTPLDGIMTNQQVVNDVLLGAGLDPTPTPDSPQVEEVVKLRAEVDRLVRVRQQGGVKVTPDDVREIADSLVIKVVTEKGSFMGLVTSGPFQDVTKRAAQLTLADMNADDRRRALVELKEKGITATPETMLNIYRRRKVADARKALEP